MFYYNDNNINLSFLYLSYEIRLSKKSYICYVLLVQGWKFHRSKRKLFLPDNVIQQNVFSIVINYLVRANLLR